METNFLYQYLIKFLYDNHLESEKSEIIEIQKAKFLNAFSIQKGDVIELTDGRLVVVNSTEINFQYEIIIEYLILKVNLEYSKRARKITCDDIMYVLKSDEFLAYKSYSSSRHISLLKKWMSKRKRKIDLRTFEPNLIEETM